MKATDKDIANQLCKQHGINVRQARYREDGKWYHYLTGFPGAYLDKDGIVIFKSKQEYESCKQLSFGKDVNIYDRRGIKSIPSYARFEQLVSKVERVSYPEPPRESSIGVSDVQPTFDEGGTREIALEIQRRNPQLRRSALRQYGTVCQVCDFDFSKAYGSIGEGFIELHHKKPLSLSRGSVITTVDDVAVVCSNCHRMLHRNGIVPLTIEELRKIVQSRRTA